MRIRINIKELDKSNHFLRALWAELRKVFGKCAWHFCPYRDGKKKEIFIGFADIGERVTSVGISYKQRGKIQTINFDEDIDPTSELGVKIQKSVSTALINTSQIKSYGLGCLVESLYGPISPYRAEGFVISPISERHFYLNMIVSGYDEIDAKTEFIFKLQKILDFLSVETNIPFWICEEGSKITEKDKSYKGELFVEDENWIDDIPYRNDLIVISENGRDLINIVAMEKANKDIDSFLRACSHFHAGRKLDAQIYDQFVFNTVEINNIQSKMVGNLRDHRLHFALKMGSQHEEISSVLYISALEVASLIMNIEIKTCQHCGQVIYSISKRVKDLVKKHCGDYVTEFIKSYYSKRSKFLHAGVLLCDRSYIGTSIPQLDPDDPTGCRTRSSALTKNLREFTSYTLRKVLKSLISNSDKRMGDELLSHSK